MTTLLETLQCTPAAWIWSAADPNVGGQLACFRLTFPAVASATWCGFADTSYTIFCNGRELGIGPATGIHHLPRLTTWDLTPYLRPGENVLALEVWFDGRKEGLPDVDVWQAGLIGWLQTPEGIIPTGPAWKARAAGPFTLASPDQRSFGARRVVIADLRQEPGAWTAPGFDVAAWQAASVVAAHPDPARAQLRLSPIPPLPVCVRRPQALIDAGVARGGRPVAVAEEVAKRMHEQTHESLVRRTSTMTVLSATEREGLVYGLPQAARQTALGWPDQSAGFRGPLTTPAVDGDCFLCWDLGLQTSGTVWLDVEVAQATAVDLGYADHLQKGRVNPLLQGHAYADRLLIGPGRHTVHLPPERGFRYLQCTCSAPLTLHDLRVSEHVFPHDDVPRFRCSDETLNAIWQMLRATAHQCALFSHVDNARRERQGWGGPDLYANMHGFFQLFGDLRLTRKTLEDFLDCHETHGFIPNFYPSTNAFIKWISARDLWFPITGWDYVLYADDRELAPRLLAASEAVLEYYGRQTVDGLLGKAHAGACRWVEWNMNAAQQVSTWENLLAVVAWRSVARLRQYLGLPGAETALATADQLTAAINARLWHPGHQALAQGTLDDGTLVDFCAQVDNAFALQHGILPAARQAAAYRFCAGRSGTWPTTRGDWQGCGQGERVRYDPRKPVVAGTPFTSSLCAQVIHQFCTPAEAVQYIRYNFGAMLDEGEGTLWEMWPVHQQEDVASTCFSQGYGTHLAATLIGKIVGLTFLDPGGSRLHWQPVPCGLAWAEGRVETQHGAVVVGWDDAGLAYRLPAGVTLHIQGPQGPQLIRGPAASGALRAP